MTETRAAVEQAPPQCGAHRHHQPGCIPCRARASYNRRRRRAAIREGTWRPRQPIEPVVAHLGTLIAAGADIPTLSRRSGVSIATISLLRMRKPTKKFLSPEIASALLDLQPDQDLRRLAPGVKATRQMRVLAVELHPVQEIADLVHVERATANAWRSGQVKRILAAAADLLDRVYHDLEHTSGRSRRTGDLARESRWLPRWYWPDETIADPDYHPHNLVFPVGTRRRLRAMAREGRPVHTIAARLNEPPAAVSAWTEGAPVPAYAAVHIGRVYAQGWGADPLFDRDRAAYADYMGWPGGIAWDGWDIDNPMTAPAGVRDADMRGDGHSHREPDSVNVRLVEQALNGLVGATELTLAERLIVVSDLSDRRWSNQQIGDHLYWGQDRKARRDLAGCFIRQHRLRSIAALAA